MLIWKRHLKSPHAIQLLMLTSFHSVSFLVFSSHPYYRELVSYLDTGTMQITSSVAFFLDENLPEFKNYQRFLSKCRYSHFQYGISATDTLKLANKYYLLNWHTRNWSLSNFRPHEHCLWVQNMMQELKLSTWANEKFSSVSSTSVLW